MVPPYDILHMVCKDSPHGLYGLFESSLLMPLSTWSWSKTCLICHAVLHMVFIEFSTWFTCILHMFSIMSPICCGTHALHTTVHMLLIMSTYASLHMVWMNSPHGWRGFSTSCCVFFLMLFSTWFAWNSPHVQNHVSICFLPYDLYRILHMFKIISPYVMFHMVCKNCPHVMNRFCVCWSPHGSNELSTCFTCVLHIIWSISTDAFLHILTMHVSTCFKSCLHMLPSTR